MSPAIELLPRLALSSLRLPVTVVLFTLIPFCLLQFILFLYLKQLYGGKICLCLSPVNVVIVYEIFIILFPLCAARLTGPRRCCTNDPHVRLLPALQESSSGERDYGPSQGGCQWILGASTSSSSTNLFSPWRL